MDSFVKLVGVTQVDGVWSSVAGGLEKACRKTGGDLTSDYLWSECRAGRAFLAVVTRDQNIIAASVWRFEKWTSGTKLRCLALYGSGLKSWLPEHMEFLNELAKAGGAKTLVSEGREGFKKIFPKARILRTLYEVELT